MASQASTATERTRCTTVAERAASDLLEDAGNCKQSIHQVLNLLPLSDSLVSEQQKLRIALDWAHTFLSSGSDHENNDRTWSENGETGALQSVAAKRGHGPGSGSDPARNLDPASPLIRQATLHNKESTDMTDEGQSDSQKELSKQSEGIGYEKEKTEVNKMERHDGKMSKTPVVHTDLSCSAPAKVPNQTAKPKPTSTSRFKIPSHLTVYEQYQLCVDQLHHLRREKSTEEARKLSDQVAEAPPTSEEYNSPSPSPATTSNRHTRETPPTTCDQFKHCDDLKVHETPAAVRAGSRSLCQDKDSTSVAHLDHNANIYAFNTSSAAAAQHMNSRMERSNAAASAVEESAALTANAAGTKGQQVRGHQSRTGGQAQREPSENLTRTNEENGGMLPRQQMRPQSAGANKHTGSLNRQRHTPEARVKHTPPPRGAHTRLQPAKAHTRHPQPAGVPVRGWLLLPDEVWLSILSLLPLSDLCEAAQACSRLHALATDHTLWKRLRLENCTVTEQWLLSVGQRRPRSLRLHSCSGRSVTASGLEMFFVLCGKTVEDVSVTGCMGPGLHGDHILTLVGRLCDRVTSVDVSWSGATDRGVKALGDGRAGSRLTSVLLNGCHITDDPLRKLVMRHKQSLCRLEVFGCQFLTATCLQTVYEMCPGLKQLNIGQVPKVTKLSLTVMTSHLKSLTSLNLTGLKAVTDALMDTLLQNCVALQSLTLSSCPRVTDLTLHNISRYTPWIRSLDVSGCKTITDLGVHSLTLGCKRLQQLDLSSTGTGSRGTSLLASHCSLHLHTVKLSFCHISTEDILQLCRRCSRLRVLHLYGCARLPTQTQITNVNSAVKVSPLS